MCCDLRERKTGILGFRNKCVVKFLSDSFFLNESETSENAMQASFTFFSSILILYSGLCEVDFAKMHHVLGFKLTIRIKHNKQTNKSNKQINQWSDSNDDIVYHSKLRHSKNIDIWVTPEFLYDVSSLHHKARIKNPKNLHCGFI